MSKKDKERKDAEKKQKKEAKKLKAEKAVEAVKEKAARKKAELDDLLGEIPTVHTDELQKYAEKHEKMAESDDKAEDEILTTVSTEKAPAAIGPYSQAVIAGDFLFASGQIPINAKTGEIDGEDIQTQARRVMKNIGKILKKAGTSYDHVVKTTCFLADLADFAAFNEVYGEYFTEKPARSCVAVKQIPKGVLCEVEVIAYLK